VRDPSTAAALTGLTLALLQLAPVLGRGYVLLRDLVFVPRLPLTSSLLGIDNVPRAVPSDLVVALLSRIVPGDVVEDVVLVALVTVGAWGAGRLLRPSLPAAVAAAALYGWNPYLSERLGIGQWAILLGYAAAPWLAAAARDLRVATPRAGRRLFLWMALAAVGGASAEVLAALVVVPVLMWPGGAGPWRRLMVAGSALAVVALPWAVPALTQPAGAPADRVGAILFAARPDTPLGTAGSLLTLGGVWDSGSAPPGRSLWLVALVALAVTVASGWGLTRARLRWDPAFVAGLTAAGAVGFALALWGAVPGIRSGLTWITSHAQAADLLRDGQRSLAPFVLVVAVGWGTAVAELVAIRRRAWALALTPLLLLPAAAWGIDGELVATHWPPEWLDVASASQRLPPGPVLVLPWASVRSYPWNGGRPLDDPAARWLPRRVVGDTRLAVGGRDTAQEDPMARRIESAVLGRAPLKTALQTQGYAGVLLEGDVAGAATAARRLAGLPIAAGTGALTLYSVPAAAASAPQETAPLALVLAADGLTGCVLLMVTVSSAFDARGRRFRS
jgi:hypothetical protein